MPFSSQLKEDASRFLKRLTWILVASYALSLLARFGWFFDLFSHFAIQYAIGGLVLGAGLLFCGKRIVAILPFFIAIISIFDVYSDVDFKFSHNYSRSFTIVQYNRNIGHVEHSEVKEWLSNPDNDFDLVVLQEAGPSLAAMASELGEIYPYQIQEPKNHAFGMVIISRHPFTEMEKIILDGPVYTNFTAKISVDPPDFDEPVTIYALHALPPTSRRHFAQRNYELEKTVDFIVNDKMHGHKIMIGDWNITPFSPYFRDILRRTGLRYSYGGIYPAITWPAFFYLSLLQIPIDHILYSQDLITVQKFTGPDFGSDHKSVLSSFKERKKEEGRIK